MKKATPIPTTASDPQSDNTPVSPTRPKPSERTISIPLRHQVSPETSNCFFAVVPDVDIEAMLCHASETLSSLSVMSADLARELEGPRRQVILAIQQLSALSELLVNRALDNLEVPRESADVSSNRQR